MTSRHRVKLAYLLTLTLTASCDRSAPTPPPTRPAPQAASTSTPTRPAKPSRPSNRDQPAPGANPAVSNPSHEWIAPDERHDLYLDIALTDQDGNELKLSDFAGKPMAITFIFTRCPLPNMCPLITTTMANLQRLTQNAGIDNDVQLLLISYDPGFDTPQRLKKYGSDRGILWTNAKMLRPAEADTAELLHELDIGVTPQANGMIGHFIELVLVDRQGRAARNSRDTVWNNQVVIEQLKKLVAEKTASNESEGIGRARTHFEPLGILPRGEQARSASFMEPARDGTRAQQLRPLTPA